jgi:hypothetical protein
MGGGVLIWKIEWCEYFVELGITENYQSKNNFLLHEMHSAYNWGVFKANNLLSGESCVS